MIIAHTLARLESLVDGGIADYLDGCAWRASTPDPGSRTQQHAARRLRRYLGHLGGHRTYLTKRYAIRLDPDGPHGLEIGPREKEEG